VENPKKKWADWSQQKSDAPASPYSDTFGGERSVGKLDVFEKLKLLEGRSSKNSGKVVWVHYATKKKKKKSKKK